MAARSNKKPRRRVTTAAAAEIPAPKPVESPPAPPADTWFRSILTDREGNFDAGAVLTCVVVVAMTVFSGYQAIRLELPFNALEFGGGIGAVLAGFAGYMYGDAHRAKAAPASTSTTTTTTVRPQPVNLADKYD